MIRRFLTSKSGNPPGSKPIWIAGFCSAILTAALTLTFCGAAQTPPVTPTTIDTNVPTIQSDTTVTYDYDIVATKAPRPATGDAIWPDIHNPLQTDASQDLVLIHPNGTEEVLVKGGTGAVMDPVMSFDGTTVYYTYFPVQAGKPIVQSKQGSDVYSIVLSTRQITKLTGPDWALSCLAPNPMPYGVFNMCPCPLPNGRIAFVSNRNARVNLKRAYPVSQLFAMDSDGSNVECIGSMNLGTALHPTILQDGRMVFSTEESQGLRGALQWSLWSIWPDGTQWGPVISHFWNGPAAVSSWHFQAQLGDGNIIGLFYYNSTFGALYKIPPNVFLPNHAFGSAHSTASIPVPIDSRNQNLPNINQAGQAGTFNWGFMPYGISALTPWSNPFDQPATVSDPTNQNSTRVGKVTHPAPAPDNHLLVCYSPNGAHSGITPNIQGTICLLKNGNATTGPADLRMIKSDPAYNYRQPIAAVPYARITGLAAPKVQPTLANDGSVNPALPAGTPYGLIGTSSFYKRESYPNGTVIGVTASEPDPLTDAQRTPGRLGSYGSLGTFYGETRNYNKQGGDDGFYTNDDVHAVRILFLEPCSEGAQTTNSHGPSFFSHVGERMKIAGEIPLRKFTNGNQPIDPDGNPDTSFLGKIAGDTAFTFQTIDVNGLQLNHSSTWHQLRPGEVRNNCGGCHAHSQTPTDASQTAAGAAGYKPWDLTKQVSLVTTKANDQSNNQQWDVNNVAGVRYVQGGPVSVEYNRDIKPVIQAKCISCHTQTASPAPGHLVLDDDTPYSDPFYKTPVPGSYARLAADTAGKFSYPADLKSGYSAFNASRYIRPIQSRRSLLMWKLYGRRLDGWTNDTAPSTTTPGDTTTAVWRGVKYTGDMTNLDLDFNGQQCPPQGSPQLTDNEKWAFGVWIDLGCPIDLIPKNGYLVDEALPTLTVQSPAFGPTSLLSTIRFGSADYNSGIDPASISVTADFAVDGQAAGANLVNSFTNPSDGVWEYKLQTPINNLPKGTLTFITKDKAGNTAKVVRVFSVSAPPVQPPVLPPLSVLRVSMVAFGADIDPTTLTITSTLDIDGMVAGTNLASKFIQTANGTWEYQIQNPLANVTAGAITASGKDMNGNTVQMSCTYSLTPPASLKRTPARGGVSAPWQKLPHYKKPQVKLPPPQKKPLQKFQSPQAPKK